MDPAWSSFTPKWTPGRSLCILGPRGGGGGGGGGGWVKPYAKAKRLVKKEKKI